VVENDEISTKIIRYLSAEKGGRVTFIPLNRVHAPKTKYPNNPDVVPLLKKLKFSSHFSAAFAQVKSPLDCLDTFSCSALSE
jgi:structural maintenance of chromosome 3 (chondroitin sulfate proteoglycan 6)